MPCKRYCSTCGSVVDHRIHLCDRRALYAFVYVLTSGLILDVLGSVCVI
jgi:hypothetical protein